MNDKPDPIPVARFPLPGNWTPAGRTCITFAIPDDPEYVSAIIGLVDTLKWSRSFGRDPTRTGAAIVSRTWQDALESRPVEIGCEMVCMHRVDPARWWVSQESCDGGLTWHDYHIGCCGPEDGPFGTGGDAGTTPADLAADILRNWHIFWTNAMYECIHAADCGRPEFETFVCDALGDKCTPEVQAQFGDAYDIATGVDDDDLHAMAQSECVWAEQHRCMVDKLRDKTWQQWLDTLDDVLSCALNSLSDALVSALNTAADMLGSNKFSDYIFRNGAGGGGGGFGATGGCDIIVLYGGRAEHSLSPGNVVCEKFLVNVPTGYSLSAIVYDYSTNWTGVTGGTGVYRGSSPDCQALPGQIDLWGGTSQSFDADYTRQGILRTGQPSTLFADAGFDMSGAPTAWGDTWTDTQAHGPGVKNAPIRWLATTSGGIGIVGSFEAWFIMVKLP